MPSDQEIIENFMKGDEDGFSELVQKYLDPVFNFLYRLTKDKAAAEDLAQETFLKAWKNIGKFDLKRNFKTWIFSIAKNTAFDYFKKKKTIPFSNFIGENGNSQLENISDGNILPDEILERKDIAKEIDAKLKKIPEHYQIILILRYKEDFTLSEIAKILGKPYNTIKSGHKRALNNLKNLLA